MNDMLRIPSVDVLQNRGIGVLVNVLRQNAQGMWERAVDADGNNITELAHLKFTNWTLALLDMEPPVGFGGMDNWQEEFSKKMQMTLSKSIALMEEKTRIQNDQEVIDARYGALRMVDNKIAVYANVVMGAFMLAQGVDPGKVLDGINKRQKAMEDRLSEGLEDDEPESLPSDDESVVSTPTNRSSYLFTQPSTPDGRKSEDEATTSSGN